MKMQLILSSPLSVKDIWLDDENDLIRSCGALSKVIININNIIIIITINIFIIIVIINASSPSLPPYHCPQQQIIVQAPIKASPCKNSLDHI